jgi:hypothetical protein
MYIKRTFISFNEHVMYMRRPSIPEEIHKAVENEAREYEDAWRETLERILEQETDIEIPSKVQVEA